MVKELGYSIESLELEKYWEIERKGKKSWARADIIVRHRNHDYMLIKVKAPSKYDTDIGDIKTHLFNVASFANKNLQYLIYYTAEIFATSIKEKLITIDLEKYKEFEDWGNAGRPNPLKYGLLPVMWPLLPSIP